MRTLDPLRLRENLGDADLSLRREAVFRLAEEVGIVEPTAPLLARASRPFPTPLDTLDAVHLATALRRRERVLPSPQCSTILPRQPSCDERCQELTSRL